MRLTWLMTLPIIIPIAFLIVDVLGLGRLPNEGSMTELAQSLCLLLTMAAFAMLALRAPVFRALGVAFVVLLMIAFTREQDGYLNAIYHGAWLPFALVLGVVLVGVLILRWRAFWAGFALLRQTRAFGVLVFGFLMVMIFSRLLGTTDLWEALVTAESVLTVKTVVQETLELLGYTLILNASVDMTLCLTEKRA